LDRHKPRQRRLRPAGGWSAHESHPRRRSASRAPAAPTGRTPLVRRRPEWSHATPTARGQPRRPRL